MDDFNQDILSRLPISERIPMKNKISEKDISSKLIVNIGHPYYCYYNTFETESYYVWINFTATEVTYNYNIKRYLELIGNVKMLNFHKK